MDAAKRRGLVARYALISLSLEQIERACLEGHSPTGMGAPLTPLSADVAEPVLAPLRSLRAALRLEVAKHAPEELAALEGRQARSNTYVWVSNLLERIRQAVDDLEPRRMARYGTVSEADAEALFALHAELARHVAASRTALDAAAEAEEGPSANALDQP